jgi:hypothetical protein
MRSILAVLACAVLIAAAMAGCGRSKTVTTPEGTATVTEKGDTTTVTFEGEGGEGTFQIEGDKVGGTVKTDEGTLEYGTEVKLTEKDIGIPFYPGAKAAHSGKLVQTGEDQGEFIQVAFTTPDSVDKVKAFYKEKIAGVEVRMEMSTADTRMVQMMAEDGNTQKSVVITRGKDDKETQIGLTRVTKSE